MKELMREYKWDSETKTYLCKYCKRQMNYVGKYDTFACYHCDIWMEDKCKDKNCYFCKDRPEKPTKL